MKKVMILGGGKYQVPFIKKAKELGHYVVLCDYLENNPGRKYSDIHYLVSTHDYNQVIAVAKKEEIDGVVTNSEPVMHIMSKIMSELNLPCIPPQIMELFLNKKLMRDYLEKRGLNTIRYRYVYNKAAAKKFLKEIDKKIVMKPVDSSASKGVFSIRKDSEIEKFFDITKKSNRREEEVLLEEYISGPEFTVDGICISGKHYTLGISEKHHFAYNENVADALFFSSFSNEYDYESLKKYNDEIVQSTLLPFGMTHSEYKYENGKFHFIEMSARGGGAYIATSIIPFMSGIDTMKLLFNASLGIETKNEISIRKEYYDRCAILKFFSTPDNKSGYVKEIKGAYILNTPNVIRHEFFFDVGDYIKPAENDSERIGYYIAVANTKEQLNNIIEEIENTVKIILGE